MRRSLSHLCLTTVALALAACDPASESPESADDHIANLQAAARDRGTKGDEARPEEKPAPWADPAREKMAPPPEKVPAPEHPIPGERSCGELHVFGTYEPVGRREPISVIVDRPGSHVLVLSSYESATWVLSSAPAAHIERVIVLGYKQQRVVSKTPVKVESHTYADGTLGKLQPCGYSWPYNGGGCDTGRLLNDATRLAGRGLTSFQGTYIGSQFGLRKDLTPAVGTSNGYPAYHIARPGPCSVSPPKPAEPSCETPEKPVPPPASPAPPRCEPVRIPAPPPGPGPDLCPAKGTACKPGEIPRICQMEGGRRAFFVCDKESGYWRPELIDGEIRCESPQPDPAPAPCSYDPLPAPPEGVGQCPKPGSSCADTTLPPVVPCSLGDRNALVRCAGNDKGERVWILDRVECPRK